VTQRHILLALLVLAGVLLAAGLAIRYSHERSMADCVRDCAMRFGR